MVPIKTKLSLSFFVFLLMLNPIFGQLIPTSTKYFSYDQGLPDRIVYDVHQDNQGMMWVSTTVGLSMFDGYDFKTFTNIDIPDISKKINIRGSGVISEDGYQNLVISPWNNDDKIEIFNVYSFESSEISLIENEAIQGNVQDVYTNLLDHCYILSKNETNFFLYQINKNHQLELIHTIPSTTNSFSDKNKLFVSSANNFWIFDYEIQKITHYIDGKNHQDFSINKNSSTATAMSLFFEDKKGTFWFSSTKDQQLYKILPNEKHVERVLLQENQPLYTKVWEDKKGNLLFANQDELFVYDLILLDNNKNTINLSNILETENKITNIQGNDFFEYLYVSSHNGFYQFLFPSFNKNIKHFLNKEIKAGEFGAIMRGITADNDGIIYVNTEGGEWFSLDTTTWTLTDIPLKDGQGNLLTDRSCNINLIFDGKYLWGTSCKNRKEGMVHRYDVTTKTWEAYSLPFDDQYPRMIIPKSDGEFWIATFEWETKNTDLFLLDTHNNKFTNYKLLTGVTPPLQGKRILNGLKDSEGIIWLASNKGMVMFDAKNETFETYYINPEFEAFNIIGTIQEIDSNQLMVGVYEQGLFLFDKKEKAFSKFRFTQKNNSITTNKILPNNFVAGIVPVEDDNFLVSTFNGLAYIESDRQTSSHFFSENGLSNNEFNRMSHYVDAGKNIYIGGINGFDVFKIEDLKNKKTLKKTLVTSFFKYDGDTEKEMVQFEKLNFDQPIQIQPNILQFGFNFMLPEYANIDNHLFQTWLEGWENNFGDLTKSTSVNYFRLPAGDYKLHIRSKDNLGNSSLQDLIIPIHVQQVFYKTYWFLGLCLASLIGGILFLTKRRIEKIKEEQRRQKELRLIEQRFTELELKTVRLQLNPHFMFNALGAIQHYINNNDKRLAINYLADFARLMRLFLESSKKRFVTLADEMEMIQLYVSLEQMRFDHKFEVNYKIAENIDPDEVELPSLLLQPFIENAINHGLYHKKEKGLLSIGVQSDDENHIQFIIEDDGIGRTRAADIKKQSLRKHKSRGTEIVQERLETLNASGEILLKLTVNDAFVNQEDCGTRVVLSITDGD